jgi:serine/threonine-protein kinase RsbW
MTTVRHAENTVTLILNSRLEDVFLAGLAVRGICQYTPLDPSTVCQVELCVVEAVTNSVKHAYGGQAGCEVRLEVSLSADRIQFDVSDTGLPMKTLNTPDPVYDRGDRDALPESGTGLFIIRSVMDRVSYSSEECGRNVLRMIKLFPAE